jgi:endogenous inhibitor of DNA gyrase (YacG/DUF329 family)
MPVTCPTCGKPPVKPHHPFCSERCSSVDLGRWFAGKYIFASTEPPENEDLDAIINAIESGQETDDASENATSQARIMPFPRKPN